MTKLQELDSLVDFVNAIRDCDAKYIEGTVVTDDKVSNFENSPHEYVREYIPKLADEIRQKARGGMIYGEYIDVNDEDSMIVAAYHLGMSDPSVALRVPLKAPPDPPGYTLKAHERPEPRPLYRAREIEDVSALEVMARILMIAFWAASIAVFVSLFLEHLL